MLIHVLSACLHIFLLLHTRVLQFLTGTAAALEHANESSQATLNCPAPNLIIADITCGQCVQGQ